MELKNTLTWKELNLPLWFPGHMALVKDNIYLFQFSIATKVFSKACLVQDGRSLPHLLTVQLPATLIYHFGNTAVPRPNVLNRAGILQDCRLNLRIT